MKFIAKFSNYIGSVACLLSILATTTVFGQSLDIGFNPDVTGPYGHVYTTFEQSTGQILVGGDFTSIGGGVRTNFARLNHNGTLDASFTANANGEVYCLAEQPDGKILVGGDFSKLAGETRNGIARLSPDGSLDADFHPVVLYSPDPAVGGVSGLALQPDGRIVIGGGFTSVNGQPRTNLARLNSDGSVDANFKLGTDNPVFALKVLANGKVLVAGEYGHLGGQITHGIGRLNPDGTLDGSFTTDSRGPILAIQVQADGRILIGGYVFSFVTNGQYWNQNALARLNSDGSVDTSFKPNVRIDIVGFETYPSVYSLALQPDGKILLGGEFAIPGRNITRLLPDGSVDATFHASAGEENRWVNTVTVQADGDILVGGLFSTLDGIPRYNLGRFHPDDPPPPPSDPTVQSNGVFSFAFPYTNGTTFTVLATTNLALPSSNWDALGSTTLFSNGLYRFTDPTATNFPRRFYRLRTP
jgi:uncharacterized delta-60 repeat protein